MLIKLDAHLKNYGDAGYVAWIDNSKNMKMAVQANTPEKAVKELLISLKVKIAYMFGVDINSIEEKEFNSEAEFQKEISEALKQTGKKELQFQIA